MLCNKIHQKMKVGVTIENTGGKAFSINHRYLYLFQNLKLLRLVKEVSMSFMVNFVFFALVFWGNGSHKKGVTTFVWTV